VNNALARGNVESADRFQHGFRGFRSGARFQGNASLVDRSTSGATAIAIAQAALFVLAVTFDLRLNVSQGSSSKKILPFFYSGKVFYMKDLFLSRKRTTPFSVKTGWWIDSD
jgi:hypothetical protein